MVDRAQLHQLSYPPIVSPILSVNHTERPIKCHQSSTHLIHSQSAMKEKTTRPQLQQNYSRTIRYCPEVSSQTVLSI